MFNAVHIQFTFLTYQPTQRNTKLLSSKELPGGTEFGEAFSDNTFECLRDDFPGLGLNKK